MHTVIVTPPELRDEDKFRSTFKLLLAVSADHMFAPLLIERGLLPAIAARILSVNLPTNPNWLLEPQL